MVGADLCVRPF